MAEAIDEALDKIYSFVDYSMTHQIDVDKKVFTLDKIKVLLNKLGNPQKAYPVIHVAGTKGKGSVCAMLAAALQNTGLKVGLYTSPHLIKFNERIIVDGKMISDADVIDLTDRIGAVVSTMTNPASAFEFMAAMAFQYFKEQKVDVAVVETGLGGRLDATNTVDPILTVITSISIDHTNFLGDTIEQIAGEKAGIIKKNVPVICGPQQFQGAKYTIYEAAKKQNAPWIYVPDRYRYINLRSGLDMQQVLIWRVEDQKLMEDYCGGAGSENWEPTLLRFPLPGLHQMDNAATAFAALMKLKGFFPAFNMTKAIEGLEKTFWPCRMERVSESPLVILDGAHNDDSMKKLCAALDKYCGTRTIKCVFGASEDKKIDSMIRILAPHVDEFIMTKSSHPRAADPKLLQSYAVGVGRHSRIAGTIEEAYRMIESETDGSVCYIVTGSLFTAGDMRGLYMKKDNTLKYFSYNE